MAIARNIIDFAFGKKFDVKHDIERVMKQEFAIFHYKEFKENLDNVSSILYIGDNAGESVFDRLLIEELNKKVT